MPGAAWQGEHGSVRMARYDVVCIHTIVGHDPAHAAHFSTGSDGTIAQSRDTVYQSAANYEGNPRVIAIENEDFGPEFGTWTSPNVPGFTAAQIESIAQILAWCHRVHGIPLVLCPDSRPGSRGIAYHRQGIDGNFGDFAYGGRVSGGEHWSTSFGKICPGDRRISQLIEVIIPRARRLAGLDGGSGDSREEEQMQPLKPGTEMALPLIVPGRPEDYVFVIYPSWEKLVVHKISFVGGSGGSGVNWIGQQWNNQFQIDPGRPVQIDLAEYPGLVAVELNYTWTNEKKLASAGFRRK